MKRIKIILAVVIFFAILLLAKPTKAAGTVSLSASKGSVTVGEEFSITVSLNGASAATLTSRISVDTSKVDYVSGPGNSNFSNGKVIYTWTDPNGGASPISGNIATFKFKAKAAGKASFGVSGDFFDASYTNLKPSFLGSSVTVNPKATSTPEPVQTPQPEPEVTPPSGGGTSGSTGGTAGGTTGGTTGGSANKPTSGGNTSNPVSNNANLKALHLNIEGLSPVFNKNTTKYYLTVADTINEIGVTAEPEEAGAKVLITGNTNLAIGMNTIKIVVTAPDNKTTKTYSIQVTKTDNPDNANANLLNLAIENITLEPEFSPDVMQYQIQVGSEQESLNILAVPQIEGASVVIEGKDNLVFGENTITITVTAKDGITIKTYTIIAHRKTLEEEQAEIMPINEEREEENVVEADKIETGSIIYSAIVLVSVGGVIYMIVRKYVKESKVK